MKINSINLAALFTAVSLIFQNAFAAYVPTYKQVAMDVESTSESETYAWLEAWPEMHEWLGERTIKDLSACKYAILNRDWESTVGIPRNSIEDDKIGIFKPMFAEQGRVVAAHPDKLVYGLLAAGFVQKCYDGLPFFSAAHKVGKNNVSNMDVPQSNPGNPWFLLDTSRAIKPLIYQSRKKAEFTAQTNPDSEEVFKKKKFLFGVDTRDNVGFGLWQMAFGSKQALTDVKYAAARAAIGSFTNEEGTPLGMKGTLLVVGPSNEAAGRVICYSEHLANGASNPWKGTAELLVVPWLA